MDIGCHLPMHGPLATREALLTFCREAEARGVNSLWVSDHVVFPRTETGEHPGGPFPFPSEMAYLEAVTVLAAAATVTERARLGASVFILGHRHPVVMAKMLSTIDVLSNGRLICGVGVGWWEEELSLLGVPYRRRGAQADEMIQVFKALWTQEHPGFEGHFYTIPDVGFAPKPVQKPHPPIWVGGDSPGAYKRAAVHADGWHATAKSPEEAEVALGKLRAAADAAGRPFESITRSIRFNLKQDPRPARARRQELVDRIGSYKALGFTDVLLDFRRDTLDEMLDDLDVVTSEVQPAVDRA
jgi:probable F420-dependent oxidoreductase